MAEELECCTLSINLSLSLIRHLANCPQDRGTHISTLINGSKDNFLHSMVDSEGHTNGTLEFNTHLEELSTAEDKNVVVSGLHHSVEQSECVFSSAVASDECTTRQDNTAGPVLSVTEIKQEILADDSSRCSEPLYDEHADISVDGSLNFNCILGELAQDSPRYSTCHTKDIKQSESVERQSKLYTGSVAHESDDEYTDSEYRYVLGKDGLCYIEYEYSDSDEESNEETNEETCNSSSSFALSDNQNQSQEYRKSTTTYTRSLSTKSSEMSGSSSGTEEESESSGEEWTPGNKSQIKLKPQQNASKPSSQFKPQPRQSASKPSVVGSIKMKNANQISQRLIQKTPSQVNQACVQKLKAKALLKKRLTCTLPVRRQEGKQVVVKTRNLATNKTTTRIFQPQKVRQIGPKVLKIPLKPPLKPPSKSGQTLLQCPHCPKEFKAEAHLKEHVQRMCHKLFPDLINKKNYTCRICSYSTLVKDELVKHMKTHKKKEGRALCEVCGKTLSNKSSMYMHLRVFHNKFSPVKWFHCKLCNRKFYSRSHYNRHLEISHTEGDSYICDVCGRGFKVQDSLKKHKMWHDGKYNFHCPKCGHGMYKKSQLESHVCGRTRRRRDHLRQENFRNEASTPKVQVQNNATESKAEAVREQPKAVKNTYLAGYRTGIADPSSHTRPTLGTLNELDDLPMYPHSTGITETAPMDKPFSLSSSRYSPYVHNSSVSGQYQNPYYP